jgi:hypothetical protein
MEFCQRAPVAYFFPQREHDKSGNSAGGHDHASFFTEHESRASYPMA